jgi:hypothetical protein
LQSKLVNELKVSSRLLESTYQIQTKKIEEIMYGTWLKFQNFVDFTFGIVSKKSLTSPIMRP